MCISDKFAFAVAKKKMMLLLVYTGTASNKIVMCRTSSRICIYIDFLSPSPHSPPPPLQVACSLVVGR